MSFHVHICSILLICSFASIPVAVANQDYDDMWLFYEMERQAEAAKFESQGEIEALKSDVEINSALFVMAANLYEKNAIAEIEFHQASVQKEVSIYELQIAKLSAENFDRVRQLNRFRRKIASGETVDIESMKTLHKEKWETQCEISKCNELTINSKFEFHKRIYSIQLNLDARAATSATAVMNAKKRYVRLESELQAAKKITTKCLEGPPFEI